MENIVKNIKETQSFASEFAKTLFPGCFVALYGDLGVGKTVFTKAVVESLGGKGVTSPTFTILNEYNTDPVVYHFDMYRLKDSQEIENIGYENYFYGDGICLVEWPNRIQEYLPKRRIDVTIERIDENQRKIRIEEKK